MAAIREELRLVDYFSGPLISYAQGVRTARQGTASLQSAARQLTAAQRAGAAAAQAGARVQGQLAGVQRQQAAAARAGANAGQQAANAGRSAAGAAQLLLGATRSNTAAVQANTAAAGANTAAVQANTLAAGANTAAVLAQAAAAQSQTTALLSLSSALAQHNRMQTQARIAADIAAAEMRRQQGQMDASRASANGLASSLRGVAGAYLSFRGIVGIGRLSDELVSSQARLDLMNDGLQSTAQLQEMIYQAANRTGGSYLDMTATVSKLGILAGQAFDSTKELVAFTELLNKNFVVGGAAPQEQSAAMYQLTQAMASGRLQGDEYRSIIENAPLLAQSIEDYMRNVQKVSGSMKDWASQGLLTADVIKAAMFNSADEVEARFASMPKTWGQTWQLAQNIAIKTFQPLLQVVGAAAGFVSEHIEAFIGAFYGLAAAVAVYYTAVGIATIISKGLIVTLMESPLLPIAAAFMVIGAAINVFISRCGGAKAAWLTFVDTALTYGENFKIGIVNIFYQVCNWLDETGLHIATMATNISNSFGDLKADVLKHLQDLVNGGIGYVNRFINVLNKIPGVNIAPVEAASFGDKYAANNTAAKAARNTALANQATQVAANFASRAGKLSAMELARDVAHAARLTEIENARNATDASGLSDYGKYIDEASNNLAGIAGDTKAIKNAVDMSDETLKMLVDMAERRYVNNINLTAQSPVIQVQGQNTGDTMADRYKLADALRDVLLEQASAGATRSTAMVF